MRVLPFPKPNGGSEAWFWRTPDSFPSMMISGGFDIQSTSNPITWRRDNSIGDHGTMASKTRIRARHIESRTTPRLIRSHYRPKYHPVPWTSQSWPTAKPVSSSARLQPKLSQKTTSSAVNGHHLTLADTISTQENTNVLISERTKNQ